MYNATFVGSIVGSITVTASVRPKNRIGRYRSNSMIYRAAVWISNGRTRLANAYLTRQDCAIDTGDRRQCPAAR
jgi:hypothetical protein